MTAGGRFRGSRPVRNAIANRTPAASTPGEPGCLCGQGPVAYPSNPLSGSVGFGLGTGGIAGGPGVTSCPDVLDQRVEVDIGGTWGTAAGDFYLWVRRVSSATSGGYAYYYWAHTQFPWTSETRKLLVARSGVGDLVIDSGTFLGDTRPQAGDVFELEAIGTAIEVRCNGTPILSATDSTFTPDAGATAAMGVASDAYDSSSNPVAFDLVTEDFCP